MDRARERSAKRPRDDWYPTPAPITRALLDRVKFDGPVWEPACGDGAMAREILGAGYDVIASDLVDRGFGCARRDFLLETRADPARAIITNPPFKLANEFVYHALQLAPQVAMFLPIAFLFGTEGRGPLWRDHPACLVLASARRIALWPGDMAEEAKTGSSTINYAWFVWWEQDLRAGTRVERFDWMDYA